jgi:hypothetical protein
MNVFVDVDFVMHVLVEVDGLWFAIGPLCGANNLKPSALPEDVCFRQMQ